MKNIFKIGLFSLAISLCIGSGAISLKNEKPATRVEAAGEAWQSLYTNEYFATTKEALDQKGSAQSYGIKLLRDTTETQCNVWLTSATVVVDLNGHTLTVGSQDSPVAWYLAFAAGAVDSNLNLTIKSTVAGGKINAYCSNAVLYIDPTQTNGYTCQANIQSGVQIKNFSTGRTAYVQKGTTLTVNDGASLIATDANQPAAVIIGGTVNNYGTLQGVTNGATLEPTQVSGVTTTPTLKMYGANALVTPRIYSKRNGGVSLFNYSYSENNASVYLVNVVFDESLVSLTDNQVVFSDIHWKYKDNFANYITISAAGSAHHTLTWAQQVANQTGYLRWVRNTYTVSYNINGGKSGTTTYQSVSAEQSVSLRSNGFVPQDYYRFKEWNTRADGTGTHLQPGQSFTPTANITLFAIWESAVEDMVNDIKTRSSLAYHYSKDGEGNFTFTNLYVRFGGIIDEGLWNAIEEESHIVGYGELISTEDYLGANALQTYYLTANSNPNIEVRSYELTSDPESYPVLYNDSEYQGVTDDYYVWNYRMSVDEADYTTVYASVAFIITQDDGVYFMDEVRKSVKDLAQDLIDGPNYNAESLGGSLNYLANL